MYGTNKNLLTAIIILLAVSLVAGCSTAPKKPAGASARAQKGITTSAGTGDDTGLVERPIDIPGTQIPITENSDAKEYGVCQRIHFDYDKYEIKQEWTDCLDRITAFLSDKTGYNMVIEGHCDERGTNEYNLALGEKRAKAVADFLIEKGVSAERIIIRSWGKERPIAFGHDENSWWQNRRAEFYVLTQ